MVPLKKKKALRKTGSSASKKTTKKLSSSMLFKKRMLRSSAFFVIMLLLATQITTTTPLYADTSFWGSVLGDNDEKEEKREEKREDQKPEVRQFQQQKIEEHREVEFEKPEDDSQDENELESENETEDTEDNEDDGSEDAKPFVVSPEMRLKHETEMRTADGQKIKTKVEDDGTTKIELEGKDYKFKYVVRDGRFRVKAENEAGDEVDVPDEATNEMEIELREELEAEGIEVDESVDGPEISKDGFKAHTVFPLSINPLTRELTVSTPAGERVVTVLPDKAMQNLLATGVLTEPEGASEIVEREGKMVYKIKGNRRHRMFGFIPVTLPATGYVSAEDGEPVEKEQSVFANLVDAISL